MINRLLAVILVSCIAFNSLYAQEKSLSSTSEIKSSTEGLYIPADLSPWIEWLKQSNSQWQCARNNNLFECTWPGTLRYSLNASGAEFVISIEMLDEGSVPLPSTAGLYPRQISVFKENGDAVTAPLSLNENQLWIKLPKGKLEIKGSFNWNTIPHELPAPSSYGLIEVSLPNELKNLKARRGPQSLWLEKQEENSNTDSLNLSVMRRISDGSPLSIETLIRLRISGRSRPFQIPSILPANSQAVTLESPLPAQLSSDGSLALQLLPGECEVRILSLLQQPVSEIKVPTVKIDAWPNEEIWSWQPDMNLRSVELSGGQPLHADLTQLPTDWKGGAVYVVSPGADLKLNETRRGEQSKAPNSITLSREFWIDLDGTGATVLDRFSGRLNKDFRINAQPDTQVGRATVDGAAALVTLDPKNKSPGVELRSQALNMEVVSRVANAREVSASGWDINADQLSVLMNLPPSWKLLHVSGAAQAIGSWVDSWTLLNIFITILLALASYKIFGRLIAILLGISLVLNHGEFLAPQMLYVHIMLLATWRTLTSAKESIWSTLSKSLLTITFAAWALQSLAFAKLQFTEVLFPQLQSGTRHRTIIQEFVATLEGSILVWPIFLLLIAFVFIAVRSIFKAGSIFKAIMRIIAFGIGFIFLISFLTALNLGASRSFVRSAPQQFANAPYPMSSEMADNYSEFSEPSGGSYGSSGIYKRKMQTEQSQSTNAAFSYQGKNLLSGPALPSWRWHSVGINLANPVSPEHKLHFYFLAPNQGRIISALRTALALLLIVLIFKALGFSLGVVKNITASPLRTSAGCLLALFLLMPKTALADIPSKEMMDALKAKFEQKLCYRNECTVIESAKFTCSNSGFKLELAVSSEGISWFQVPGPLEVLSPQSVTLNGKSTVAMRRNEAGYLEVRTNPGKNIIELQGALPDPQSFTVQFNQTALVVSIDAPEWYIEGLNSSGTVRENLRFIRRSAKEQVKDLSSNPVIEGLNNWVRVSRNVIVGEQISVQTNVERLGSFSREAHVKVALLPGEQVTSGAVSIENGELLIGFSAGLQTQTFTSVLPFAEQIKFVAKPLPNVAEQWTVSCQPILSCEFTGLQASSSTIDDSQSYLWRPFPGEEVIMKIAMLAGLKGDFVTVDNLTHNVRWGTNLLEGDITASVRATQQTTFKITAPPEASIKEVILDGQAGQSSEKGSESALLLSPGPHSIQFSYSKSWSPEWKEHVPLISLSAPINNLTINVTPSFDRWLLWTGGLAWGPCVVFWAKLLLVILLCVAFSKLELIPGSLFGAVLLGMGITTLPLWAIAIPLGWLVAIKLIPLLGSKLMFIPRIVRTIGFIGFCVLAVTVWYNIVQTGLVFSPPMLIAGNGSTAFNLKWYVDHVAGTLPTPYVISLPIWCWRVVALVWSTWLVIALFGWLKSCVGIIRSDFIVAGTTKS